jgi:hypothetical protein
MTSRVQNKIREALRANPDGLTAAELYRTTGLLQNSIYPALPLMPEVYIDRWTRVDDHWVAVWISPPPPPNAEKPERPV